MAWVQSLGWGDLLEEGMATHSSILAWRIPWTEEPDRLKTTVVVQVTQLCPTVGNPMNSSMPSFHFPHYRPQGPKDLDMTEATEHTA